MQQERRGFERVAGRVQETRRNDAVTACLKTDPDNTKESVAKLAQQFENLKSVGSASSTPSFGKRVPELVIRYFSVGLECFP